MTTPFAPTGLAPAPTQYQTKSPPPTKKPPAGPPFRKQPGNLNSGTPNSGPPVPTGPPIPVLQSTKNYHGSVTDINTRVQAVTDAYTQAYGTTPTPGLVLDVATSPLDTNLFPHLFTVPKNPMAAQARGTLNNHPPEDQLIARHDGYVEANNPVRQLMTNHWQLAPQAVVGPAPLDEPPAPMTQQRFQQLQKGHPWVAAGMLPLPADLLSSFWGAVQYAQSHPDSATVKLGGQTVAQYQAQERLAQESLPVKLGSQGELIEPDVGAVQQTYSAATSVKQAQDVLKQKAPDFFSGLASTGYFNQDWATALSKYTSSTQYFRQQTLQTAQDNHFGNNTAAFIGAWKTKQSLIRKYPFAMQFLQHQPLVVFDHSGATDGALVNYLTGNTKGWGWVNVPTWGLHSLTSVVGFGLDQVAGTIDQAKSEAAFATAYMQAITPKGGFWNPLGVSALGKGYNREKASQVAYKALVAKPNWVRAFVPGYTGEGTEGKIGGIVNFAGDLALGGVKLTGEYIAEGDVAAAGSSRAVMSSSNLAYNSLKTGDLGGAVDWLQGGTGAEKLNVALEHGVQDGTVSLQQYRQHVVELFGVGHTTVEGETIDGPLLRSLRTKDLPTAGRAGTAATRVRQALSKYADSFENTLASRKDVGVTSRAQDFIAGARQTVARVAPAGERRAIFDTRVPEDVYNWSRVQLGATPQLAGDLRDEFIRLRAGENIQGVSDFQEKLVSLFHQAHPGQEVTSIPGVDTGGPLVESESLTHLYFPKSIDARAGRIDDKLNSFGRLQRQTIVGGSPVFGLPIPGFGESLAYKHAAADTARRVVGGGGLFPVTRAERKLVSDYLKANPEEIRTVGAARDSAIMGENRYITGSKPTDTLDFNTGDAEDLKAPFGRPHAGKPYRASAPYKAAGGYLRRQLSSKALKAFQASSKTDVGPLIDLLSNDANLRNVVMAQPDVTSIVDGAQALFARYNEIEQAGIKAGIQDPLGDALNLLVKNVGPKADEKLGAWIKDNKIDMPVRSGLVEQKQFDDPTQWWIGKLMTANKFNRGQLFDHVFHGTTKDLVDAGWDIHDAIPVAADLAKAQTVYHMLDFSNMLQVEQNLRWLSWFATKHRLYWTWLGKTLLQRPGLAAAVDDARQGLDSKGNLNFTLYGHRLYLPASRLFWVNATEYPQTSPTVQFLAETAKGVAEGQGANSLNTAVSSLTSTSGNVLTRDDQTWALAIKTALAYTGHIPLTTNAVTFGMPATQARYFREAVNEYSVLFKQQHGDYPTEADAVKHVLLGQTAQSMWSTNLFLPVESQSGATSKTKSLLNEYSAIINPAKKRAFLDAHPDVALTFGVTQDPAVFLHNNQIWDQYNAAYKQLQVARDTIYRQILETGHFTAENSIAMSALSAAWSEKITALQVQDAATWHGTTQFPAGVVNDGKVVTPGPWGIAFQSDPLAARAFLHQAFPGIAKPQLDAHTVGETIVQLQGEASLLKAADTDAKAKQLGYLDEVSLKSRLSEINQILSPFFGYPKNAPGQLQSLYYSKFVGPYIKARDAKTAALALAPTDQQDALRSEFRAWKDQHDHPVKLTFQGHTISFPSVVQIGWARLPQAQRELGLAQAVTGDWAHIASYEKTMLGVPTSPTVSEGWSAWATALQAYNKVPGNPAISAADKLSNARKLDKLYPGFYKDYLFSIQPKLERYQRTTLYQRLPDRSLFIQYIAQPAMVVIRAIKAGSSRQDAERQWRNYVENQVTPWLNGEPDLKRALTNYGPDFLNTLVTPGG